MVQPAPPRYPISKALFLDIPYIVDSLCRHGDYALNRLHRYPVGANGGAEPRARAYVFLPGFIFLVFVLLFAAYGATLSGLCGVLGEQTVTSLRLGSGYACMLALPLLFLGGAYLLHGRIVKRFRKQEIDDGWRQTVVHVVLYLVLFAWLTPIYFFGGSLLDPTAFDACLPDLPSAPAWQQFGLFVSACVFAGVAASLTLKTTWRIAWQVLALLVVAGVLWTLPGAASGTEAAQGPYRHVYAVIVAGFAVTALLTKPLNRIAFFSLRESECLRFRAAFRRRELFDESRRDPLLSPRRIFGGCVLGILHKPLQFFLLPAFAIILVPSGFIWHACIGGTIASAMLVIASNLTRRWSRMSDYLRRYFLLGTPLVVSAAVVLIAALRLADVQYVATILNVAPFGVVFVWMVMAYMIGWWFEVQINSVLAARLLQILDGDGSSDSVVIPYRIAAPAVAAKRSRVELDNRYLLSHGIGQFVIVGWFRDREKKPTRAFNFYGFVELFDKLLGDTHPDAVHELNRRVQLYFALINFFLLLGAGALFWHFGHGDRTNSVHAVVSAQQGAGQRTVDLGMLLRATGDGNPAPAFVVAASGGGTRAALYTAAVLRGLHDLELDRNIVLLSGVSGGGVASAYFYSHRDALVDGSRRPCASLAKPEADPWDCYREDMVQPFIRDVMQGAGEWRLQSDYPLGILLGESFARRLFAGGKTRMGDDTRLGLILNTTITGHPIQDSPMLDGALLRLPRGTRELCEDFERSVSALGGGRLAFTNLSEVDEFKKTRSDAPDIQLPFVVVRDDQVELARASALTANFPPVFPNARVKLRGFEGDCTTRSYYVTDGGATENLGLISALLALESALNDALTDLARDSVNDSGKHADAQPGKRRLRDIDIVLAEASAIGYDYEQDRGVDAATGQAKERLAGRLTLELLRRVEEAAAKVDPKAVVRIHDLSLPRVFRSREGFGTHWMYPETIHITTPRPYPLPSAWHQHVAQYSGLDRYWVTLDKKENLFRLWQGLFEARGSFCEKQWTCDPYQDLKTVSDWICGRDEAGNASAKPDAQLKNWEELRELMQVGQSGPRRER